MKRDKAMSGTPWKEYESWAKPGGEERMRKYGAKQDMAAMKQRPAPKPGEYDYDAYRRKMLELKSTASGKNYQDLVKEQEYMDEAREAYKARPGYAKHYDFNKWLNFQKGLQQKVAMILSNNPNRTYPQKRVWG
jgi:hypothetical protein